MHKTDEWMTEQEKGLRLQVKIRVSTKQHSWLTVFNSAQQLCKGTEAKLLLRFAFSLKRVDNISYQVLNAHPQLTYCSQGLWLQERRISKQVQGVREKPWLGFVLMGIKHSKTPSSSVYRPERTSAVLLWNSAKFSELLETHWNNKLRKQKTIRAFTHSLTHSLIHLYILIVIIFFHSLMCPSSSHLLSTW